MKVKSSGPCGPLCPWGLMAWMVWTGSVLFGICQGFMAYSTEGFQFTQDFYNATIKENAIVSTSVKPTNKMGIQLRDANLEVVFRISGGNTGNVFKAEEVTVGDFCFLIVKTRTNTNRELQRQYHLKIKAIAQYKTGPSTENLALEAYTDLIIDVLDDNDLSPLFDLQLYNVTIHENLPLHSTVIKVTASDADVGVNAEIYYSFLQKTNVFAIHPTTGVITVTRPLTYMEQKEYNFNILAQDRGPKFRVGSIKRSTARIRIFIRQSNFYVPEISVKVLPEIIENAPTNTMYAVLSVLDKDSGYNGEIESVEIIEGNKQGIFDIIPGISSDVYQIIVKGYIDREKFPQGFNLTIQAKDKGQPPNHKQTVIHVSVSDANDNSPAFTKDIYKTQLKETVLVGTPVLRVEAIDLDIGKNGEVRYEIVGGNEDQLFSINSVSGLITTAGILDAETNSSMTLDIMAYDQAYTNLRRSGQTQVIVTVLDCNDNSPIFNVSNPIIVIDENLPVGTVVYHLNATDLDSGYNGNISFSIANVKDVPFEIDHFTGKILVTKKLDFETMQKIYKLKVQASDWGSPFKKITDNIVTFKLQDRNDNIPLFEKTDCKGYLLHEAKIGTQLVTLPAIDFDYGNTITYRIISGNDDKCYHINSKSSEITVDCDLSAKIDTKRALVVEAFDGDHASLPSTVIVNIVSNRRNFHLTNSDADFTCKTTNVTEEVQKIIQTSQKNNQKSANVPESLEKEPANKNVPLFSDSLINEIAISENLKIGTAVLHVEANDPDPGFNGLLTYVVSEGNYDGKFSMSEDGHLIVFDSLDRETMSVYVLHIMVSDLGRPSLNSTFRLTVNIDDENDNNPLFEKSHYEKTISENVIVNSTILQVHASDSDLGENAEIEYSLLSDRDDFYIEPASGILRVKHVLDREVRSHYDLIIKATDQGKESLTSTTNVRIDVLDINDNIPKFVPEVYNIKIREDLPLGAVVMVVTAHDPDEGQNGQILYRLLYGMDDIFEVDKLTGIIRLTGNLDFESKQFYNISVSAQDGGDPQLMSTCLVNIEVIDVNENLFAPEFDSFVTQGYVYEDSLIGSVVMYVRAKDRDEKDGSDEIVYSIRNGTGLGRFTIDNNGTIRTSQILDRETTNHYWLTVYAHDRGLVPLHSHIEVYIEVYDINDNIPQALKPVYYASTPENDGSISHVVQIEAYDLDHNPEQRLTFSITGGNPQNFFQIDHENGVITTTRRRLDREKQSQHILEVTIYDNGVPNLSSSTRVVINVEDKNDETPRFMERHYRVRVLETKKIDRPIPVFRVIATDRDAGKNGRITYHIKGGKRGKKYSIDHKSGIIYANQDLDRGERSTITVRVVDGGKRVRRSNAKVSIEIIPRPGESENPPFFRNAPRNISLMENDHIGHLVYLVRASDVDGDKLWFSIVDGNRANKFFIGPKEGNIILAEKLDWEKESSYNLTVTVTDGVHSATSWIHIRVNDTNDNTPAFTRRVYQAKISESTAVGTSVIQVSAIDQDEDKKLFYTIHMATNSISLHKFKINSQSGVISVKEELDREVLSRHELIIMVRDQGMIVNRNYTQVVINVLDHNDHAPQFLSNTFEGRVFETASVGTSIVEVQAMDKDKGRNAEIVYSIASGNIGHMFEIDPVLGLITVSKELNRDLNAEYELIVVATDHGYPSLSSKARVLIYVTISNNAPPKFEKDEYIVELVENHPSGSLVMSVFADSRSSILYRIVSGNYGNYFTINQNSGVITTKKVIDYEKSKFFNLTIVGKNMVGLSHHTCVLIHVVDENDNAPHFISSQHNGSISEGAHIGSLIMSENNLPLTVKAEDLDNGDNGQLQYTIKDTIAKVYFTIDYSTGALILSKPLDRENISKFEFYVDVNDMGAPQLSCPKPARVLISVSDLNDSPPKFSQDSYTVIVLLPTYRDVTVIQLNATDPDAEPQLFYSIVDGNIKNKFGIDGLSGQIYVKDDTRMLKKYRLRVEVTDGKFSASAEVVVYVNTTENSKIEFSKPQYTVSVVENSTQIKSLTLIQVIGQYAKKDLSFTLKNCQDMFHIGKTSGVLQTLGTKFDNEKNNVYSVVVEVETPRPDREVAHVIVKVNVLDINDNTPMFVNLPYRSVVAVDAKVGHVIKRITAIDKDSNNNGKVFYSITSGSQNKFIIDRETGDVTLAHPLDGNDENKNFNLTVRANDLGTPSRSVDSTVIIQVLHKTSPVFEKQYYTANVSEDVRPHTAIITIQANNPTGNKLIYSISSGDTYGEFSITFNIAMEVNGPCVVSVISDLDYEEKKEYKLTIRATDVNTGSYMDTELQIHVQDSNDNVPSFTSYLYTSVVPEITPIGTSILYVSASDHDTGHNQLIRYALQPLQERNDTLYFKIHAETGEISTILHLDHELRTDFYFYVIARDSGVPALSSSAKIHIRVTDVNDNPPQFEQTSYHCSISDQAERGQLVIKVSANDPDENDSSSLIYSIIDGNRKDAFMIDEKSGSIILSKHRRPEFQPTYMLNVSVSDTVYTSHTRVIVSVDNSNHYSPVFIEGVYFGECPENFAPGLLVTTVSAMDEDIGFYGLLTYTIPSKSMREYFRIDADTGEVFSEVKIDREHTKQFEIPIAAADNGGRVGYTTLYLTVTDQNDCMPLFTVQEYKSIVRHDANINTTIVKIKAVDEDEDLNGKIVYSIYDGLDEMSSKIFAIHPDTGDIFIKSPVDEYVNMVFQFFIRASDRGTPPLENNIPVEVTVMGPEESPPIFERDTYAFFVSEKDSKGTVIATITASSDEVIEYTIVPGSMKKHNNPMKFSIDGSGQIRLLETLDREEVSLYILTVRARTRTSPPLASQTEVKIQVVDVNDNPPQFESNPYIVSVAENTPPGLKLVQLSATDKDMSSKFSYYFNSDSEDSSANFMLDENSGWLTLINELDREEKGHYNLSVFLTDEDGADGLKNTASILIEVIDENDNPPVFSRQKYRGAVNEDALPGTVIITVSTTDSDSADNSDVTYYIIDGDPKGRFQIHRTGELFAYRELDRETEPRYKLTIAATDGRFVSTAIVIIDILDANDNSPVCEQPIHQVVLDENVSENTYVTFIKATDADEIGTSNAEIEYHLTGDGSQLFSIDKELGVIKTKYELDRESQQSFHLVAHAVDGDSHSCTTDVYITVVDVNDNAPEIAGPLEAITVQEDAKINSLLTRIHAKDRDLGINGKVKYRLVGLNKESFHIDESSGLLSLRTSLDRETQEMINITVMVYDQGRPSLSSEATISIILLDVNDNPPEFQHTSYQASVEENVPSETVVIAVLATSRDKGVNAKITYIIVSGNEQNKFKIDPDTGHITTVGLVDHEECKEYILTIQAKDGGTPSLTNTAIVTVTILDVNDNPPLFNQNLYSVSLMEDTVVGTSLLQVVASDRDSSINSVVTFSLEKVSGYEKFYVDASKGMLKVSEALDRETQSTYRLIILAEDSGVPRMTSSATVHVDVLDVNDNSPRFIEDNYTAFVQENRKIGADIMKFEVIDEDLPVEGHSFSFDIVKGNEGREFRINHNGVLSLANNLKKQVKEVYHLVVRVYDNPRFTDTNVTIYVTEESMYKPEAKDLSVSLAVYSEDFPGSIIGKVEATDADLYDKLDYNIISPNRHLFSVDRESGLVIANQGLDPGDYVVNVSVSDSKFVTYSKVSVTLNSVTKDMVSNAVTIRFLALTPELFISNYANSFKNSVKKILNVKSRDVHIISVQPIDKRKSKSKRSADQESLDVLFAVKKSTDSFMKAKPLRRKINNALPTLQEDLDTEVEEVFNDVCDKVTCHVGMCFSFIRFEEDDLIKINVNGESFVSARYSYLHDCVCRDNEIGPGCVKRPKACDDDPCPPFKTCEPKGVMGYRCVCPKGKTGFQCSESEFVNKCTDLNCRRGDRPMTFSGRSYARWSLTEKVDKRLSLFLRIKTHKQTSNIMYARGHVDYSILELVNGHLQYRFNCGSGEGLVLVPVVVADGKWHSVMVERRGNHAEIFLDGKFSAVSSAPGNNDVLNLNNDVYFGAEVNVYTNGYPDVRRGFEGCMEDIRIYDVRLPVNGSNAVALSQEFTKIEFHCRDVTVVFNDNNVCSSFPCVNGGSCLATGLNSYICKCPNRFHGGKCEIDSDPCANRPCLNKGHCRNVPGIPNEFDCDCPGQLTGKRCEYGRHCYPNPCKNGGVCIEGPDIAFCRCMPSFHGTMCETQLYDPCIPNPCQHGGQCRTVSSSYVCNCTVDRSGKRCENVVIGSIITSGRAGGGGINAEEIYGIAGVGAGLILIVFIFVFVRIWYKRKRDRQYSNTQPCIEGESDVLLAAVKDEEKRSKLSDLNYPVPTRNIPPSPRPPPVPNRPVSYTPSTHDSVNTLNNFDNIRNYGSAGDDLENVQNIPVYAEYLKTFSLPHGSSTNVSPLPPTLPSDTDSIQKPAWEFEYPNILEHYDEGDKKYTDNFAKSMPIDNMNFVRSNLIGRDTSSFSSLPVSESEDELPGYHWDTSDWATGPSLPNIRELPASEVPDSPSSSPHSNDSNTHINFEESEGINDSPVMNESEYQCESEYVGDSEFAENEYDNEDNDPNVSYPAPPSLLKALHDLKDDESYELDDIHLQVHPNQYLLDYQLNDTSELSNNNDSENDINMNDDDADEEPGVIHYGFPAHRYRFNKSQPERPVSEYTENSANDGMSSSMRDFLSTNASCSDISGLCDFDDSEINLSDDDDEPRISLTHLHTQV